MIEPSLDHHLSRDRFQPFRPRQKMNSARDFVADDRDLNPNVVNDVERIRHPSAASQSLRADR
jgi:hypothetical protein